MPERPETTRFYWKRLPHWEVVDGRYFVTIHLKGAIPREGAERIRRLSADVERAIANGQNGLRERRLVFRELEAWLHQCVGADHLRNPQIARAVIEAIEHRETDGTWTVFSYVIMPNHLHAFFRLGDSSRCVDDTATGAGSSSQHLLDATLIDFKRWVATQAGAMLGTSGAGFWQREWFDHWSRSAAEDERIVRYVRENPVKGGLVADWRDWPWVR